MRHSGLWLWLGSALLLAAGGFLAAGVTFAATRKHYTLWTGWPMIVTYASTVLAVGCLAAAAREISFPLATVGGKPKPNIETTFQYGNTLMALELGLRNLGPTLERATINVLVPGHATRITRMFRDGSVAPGDTLTTAERLNGVAASYWSETDVRIPGMGVSTILAFAVPVVGGQRLPVRLRIVADELIEPYEVDGEIEIPTPPPPIRPSAP